MILFVLVGCSVEDRSERFVDRQGVSFEDCGIAADGDDEGCVLVRGCLADAWVAGRAAMARRELTGRHCVYVDEYAAFEGELHRWSECGRYPGRSHEIYEDLDEAWAECRADEVDSGR